MTRGRIAHAPALDSLRALCALVVVAFHAAPVLAPGGSVGVDVFFVLSGFLITRILLGEHQDTGGIDLGGFYLRRAIRLYPALLVFVAGYLALQMMISSGTERTDQLTAGAQAVFYVMNWVEALGFGPNGAMGALGHTWSLASEEQFYLLWPVILGVGLTRAKEPRPYILALLGAVIVWRLALVALGADAPRIYFGFDTHSDALLIGCFLACVPDESRLHDVAGRTWGVPALALLAVPFLPYGTALGAPALAACLPVTAALGGWLIIGLRQAKPAPLAFPPLTYLGRISYGIYLWHFPLAFIIPAHTHLPPIGDVVAVFAFSALCAGMSHRFLERPFQAWAKQAVMGGGRASAPAPAQ